MFHLSQKTPRINAAQAAVLLARLPTVLMFGLMPGRNWICFHFRWCFHNADKCFITEFWGGGYHYVSRGNLVLHEATKYIKRNCFHPIINKPAAKQRGCCSRKVIDSGLMPQRPPQRGGVLNPRHE